MIVRLLMTGNELMNGRVVDSNSARLAQALAGLGLAVEARSTVGDALPLLVSELQRLSQGADLLIVNGGLGPTVDDRTAQALAQAAGLPLAEHPDALGHLQQWLAARRLSLNAANRKQALLPAGCDVIPNQQGSAVGFGLHLNGCRLLCTPGVPSELEAMLKATILPLIRREFPGLDDWQESVLHLFGIGESSLQQRISDHFPDWPAALELGFRASLPTLELKLRSQDRDQRVLHDTWLCRLRHDLAEWVVAEGDDSLSHRVVSLLNERSLRLSTAESCTGGMLAALITETPGASAVFDAGFITYSNRMKTELLGVNADLLEQQGAVSEAVVLKMAEGALRRSGADYAIAVSGIAGPEGGSTEKPVGTVWLAWGQRDRLRARCFYLAQPRKTFQTLIAALGLDLIRRDILGLPEARCFPVPGDTA